MKKLIRLLFNRKTIAQQINWDFEANDDFRIKDKNGNIIYYEHSSGFWAKMEYDSQGNIIYFETSNGFWDKRECDSKGNRIYFENSNGTITEPKPCENKEIIIEGVKYTLTKV